MNFAPSSPRRRAGENIVPMINVVFLLLIFFLMSAQIAPPAPVDVQAPNSQSEHLPSASDEAYLTEAATLHFMGRADADAWSHLASARPNTLQLHVDANLPAARLAELLPRLTSAGIETVDLITRPAR